MSKKDSQVNKFLPIKSRLLVSLIEKSKKTESGIILSSADPSEVSLGLVVRTGPEIEDVKVHDKILPNWQKAVKVVFDDKDFYIVSEEDVIAIFED